MNKPLSWRLLIPLGCIIFVFGGGLYSDLGIVGLVCVFAGMLNLFRKPSDRLGLPFSKKYAVQITEVVCILIGMVIIVFWNFCL